ncbi:DNA-directed RNA polymerases I, II, and III subunit RPABC3 [Komagataella kurtzmanii]|nr:DNA-directed RNA polymerases I, II, and III subunit RPABC3 [Komagataella kurtzmanii]
MSSALFDDIFTVQTVDNGRYNKVSRIIGISTTNSAIKLTLDINNEMFPVSQDDSLTVTLANSLSLDDEDESANFSKSWRPPKPTDKSLADDYDYVMFGTVYKFEEGDEDKIKVYVSFGGLLMCLEGGYKSLASLKQDNLYILIRR